MKNHLIKAFFITLMLHGQIFCAQQTQENVAVLEEAFDGTHQALMETATGFLLFNLNALAHEIDLTTNQEFSRSDIHIITKVLVNSAALVGIIAVLSQSYEQGATHRYHCIRAVTGASLNAMSRISGNLLKKCLIRSRLNIFRPTVDQIESYDTPCFCLEEDSDEKISHFTCGHHLHTACYNQLKETCQLCPLCRKELIPVRGE